MNENIVTATLHNFINYANKHNIEFARYTYECSARSFIADSYEYDTETFKRVHKYRFKDYYTDPKYCAFGRYHVTSIPNKSYLMYEVEERIVIWVCYTEVVHRGNGYIVTLLKHLKGQYPNKELIIDTYNERLRQVSNEIGISLFRN